MRFSNLFKAALAGAFLVVFAGATANAGVRININKTTQRMDVSVDGKHRYTWKVSTGKIGYGTPSGTYKPFRMEPDHFSREWDDAPIVITGGFGGGLVEEFAPIGQEVKKLVPKVKREFGDWLKEVGR
jgi:hypothetical protein